MTIIKITPTITLNEDDIQFDFIRATGPGGQNVNKVATAVQLRLDTQRVNLPADVRFRLKKIAGKQLTANETLIVTARRFRQQERNRQDGLNRLVSLLRKAAKRPKSRRKAKRPPGWNEERLKKKHHRSETKQRRGKVNRHQYDD
ncbi:alternative ribosome rescue aminoacyl-tRNA hydrolase ArfB [Anaerolineales bacterium HSG6]|nr:alternative ribosome rescue aminoacyl-tRNA hydrolase ArfB [Anaerolineales bacterium HSG6]